MWRSSQTRLFDPYVPKPPPLSRCWRQVALLEVKVRKMAELLVNVIADTKGKVEKKQAQTYEEMQVRPDAVA